MSSILFLKLHTSGLNSARVCQSAMSPIGRCPLNRDASFHLKVLSVLTHTYLQDDVDLFNRSFEFVFLGKG